MSDRLPTIQHDGGWEVGANISNRSPPIAIPGALKPLPPPPEEAHSAAVLAGLTAVAGGMVSFSHTSSSWAAAVAAVVSTTWWGFSELGEVYPPNQWTNTTMTVAAGGLAAAIFSPMVTMNRFQVTSSTLI